MCFWPPLLGYSSGSAGGSLLGQDAAEQQQSPENVEPPKSSSPLADPPVDPLAVAPTLEVPADSEEVVPPHVPEPPATEPGLVSLSDMEAQLKIRMERHAAILEKQLEDEFFAKKRKAESELDEEIELRRQKRLRDLEEDIKEELDLKNAKLARASSELAERMELVAEEQKLLDELKDKAINMQQMLEEEAKKLASAKAATQTAEAAIATPHRVDNKTSLKDRLKEKLEQTMSKARTTPAAAPSHQATTPSPTSTPSPTVPSVEGKKPSGAIVPTTDMRFSSSTHPGAWQFLYRITKREDQCDKEIYDAWHAGAWGDMLA